MYEQFYGFSAAPFARQPASGDYEFTEPHRRVLETLENRVRQGSCMCLLHGPAGVGKSALVEGLSKAPAGNPIVMRLSLDLDGVLNVSAMEKSTGLEKSITIDNAFRRYEKEEVAQAQARINALFDEEEAIEEAELLEEDASEAQAQHIQVQARALVEKAERMLEEAAPEDREDMVNLIETIQDAMTAKDSAVLREAMDELSDILYYLES